VSCATVPQSVYVLSVAASGRAALDRWPINLTSTTRLGAKPCRVSALTSQIRRDSRSAPRPSDQGLPLHPRQPGPNTPFLHFRHLGLPRPPNRDSRALQLPPHPTRMRPAPVAALAVRLHPPGPHLHRTGQARRLSRVGFVAGRGGEVWGPFQGRVGKRGTGAEDIRMECPEPRGSGEGLSHHPSQGR
jgi:hypothetical protein